MEIMWKCADEKCPPTEFRPVDCTTFGEEVRQPICGEACGKPYPTELFTPVRKQGL